MFFFWELNTALALQEDQDTYVGGLDRPARRGTAVMTPWFFCPHVQFKSSRASEFRVSEFPNF